MATRRSRAGRPASKGGRNDEADLRAAADGGLTRHTAGGG